MVARRLAAAFAAFVGIALFQAAPALAESCSFVNGTVTATISAGGEATLVVSGGEILFGEAPAPCGGATTANADSIEIKGAAGSVERLTIDQSGGTFTPGKTSEADLVAEIEIGVELFDAADTVLVRGTEGPDVLKLGAGGLRLFADNDADVFFVGAGPVLSFDLLGGADDFTGLGGAGAGAAYADPLTVAGGEGDDPSLRGGNGDDAIDGGAGADSLYGEGGADTLGGGDGADRLDGGAGDDKLTGGSGADSFYGREGADVIDAFVDATDADPVVNGGPDADKAYLDPADDPKSVPGVETVVLGPLEPVPPPPPPPTGPCSYNATTRVLTITIPAGTQPTLRVVGTTFVIDAGTPQACPTATLATTNQVNVVGQLGVQDVFSIEVAGLGGERVAVDLRDPTTMNDTVRVLGGDGPDELILSSSGLDTDGFNPNEISFQRLYVVELHGGGGTGRNVLSAAGTSQSGPFGRGVRFFAGDRGDIIQGSEQADEVFGGAGDDYVRGNGGADVIQGGGGADDLRGDNGNDSLAGGSGADLLIGGQGADSFAGGDGDDVLDARRPAEIVGEDIDVVIDGGAGTDTAYVDPGEGNRTVDVENVIGDSPTPPPTNTCDFESVSGQVTVRLAAGTQGAFRVAGDEIHFDGSPCGAATTTTTSRIVVTGNTGSVESVTIDQRGGAFAPGHVNEALNPEPGDATFWLPTFSEIEFYVDLGNDVGDALVVRGTPGNDSIAAGLKGMVLNGDGDTDVYVPVGWTTRYLLEIHGDGGRNTLSAGGAQGTGGAFNGTVRLYAGDLGDTLFGAYGHDQLFGGAGDDLIEGSDGNDLILGGGGNDSIWGNGGNDDITGGPGADTLIGGSGNDILRATDGQADVNLSGGADADTAYYDAGIDPNPVAETKIPE